MAKYRKKPVVIEAVQLRWDTWSEMCDHAGVGRLEDGKPQGSWHHAGDAPGLDIPTKEGLMHADPGDWIIRGVKDELDVCKPDIFDATYEKIDVGSTLFHNHVVLDGQVIAEETTRIKE